MRGNLLASADRTRNSPAFQPAIPLRILRQILLVIVCRLEGIGTETTALRRRLARFGRFPVDVASIPAVGSRAEHINRRPLPAARSQHARLSTPQLGCPLAYGRGSLPERRLRLPRRFDPVTAHRLPIPLPAQLLLEPYRSHLATGY